jgi:membrane protein implicated in regulation of membrane protease activity
MAEYFSNLNGMEKFFTICAMLGGVFFLIRIILQFAGVGGHGDLDNVGGGGEMVTTDITSGHVPDSGTANHSNADVSFRLLSLQGLTAFFLMFGLVGLAMMKQSRMTEVWAIMGSTLAGLGTVWLIGKIFTSMKNLQASGNIDLRHALGQEGVVYLTIPEDDTGKVQVTVQGQLKIYDAATGDKSSIKTGEPVKVVRVVGTSLLIVEKI